MEKDKIIFVYPQKASFIQLDIDILSEKYSVLENTHNWKRKMTMPFILMKQLFFLLQNIRASKIVIVSFGGYWAFFPALLGRVFRRPVFIILHGTDCASFQEIDYGSIRKFPLRIALRISYRLATRLLPVSSSLIYTENTYFSEEKVIKQGYKHFFEKIKTPSTGGHNGIDTTKWDIVTNQARNSKRFVTVLSEGQFVRKGGELIIEVAREKQDFEFIFVGIVKPEFIKNPPSNVTFIPHLQAKELLEIYNGSKYYLQLSIFEGFGCALCEAMACGCIPIVSNVNMLPDIIGDTGYVLYKNDVNSLAQLIDTVTQQETASMGVKARNRVVEKFTIAERKKGFFQVVEEVVG